MKLFLLCVVAAAGFSFSATAETVQAVGQRMPMPERSQVLPQSQRPPANSQQVSLSQVPQNVSVPRQPAPTETSLVFTGWRVYYVDTLVSCPTFGTDCYGRIGYFTSTGVQRHYYFQAIFERRTTTRTVRY